MANLVSVLPILVIGPIVPLVIWFCSTKDDEH